MVGCFVVDALPARVRVCYWPPHPALGALSWQRWLEISTKTDLNNQNAGTLAKWHVRYARLQALDAKSLRTALFWVITQSHLLAV